MPFFKINSEYRIDWTDDKDITTFVIVVVEKVTEHGYCTYVFSDQRLRKNITPSYSVIGHSTILQVSEFDMKIETGITRLNNQMKVIGKEALRTFINLDPHRPLTHSFLTDILKASDAAEFEDNLSFLGSPSP